MHHGVNETNVLGATRRGSYVALRKSSGSIGSWPAQPARTPLVVATMLRSLLLGSLVAGASACDAGVFFGQNCTEELAVRPCPPLPRS